MTPARSSGSSRLFLCLVGFLFFGCASSSRHLYGSRATYFEPERRWKAANGAASWVLEDPVTGCALRCRTEVDRWKSIEAERARVYQESAGTSKTAVAVTLPLSAPALLLLLPTFGLSAVFARETPAIRFRAEAEAAEQRGSMDEAADDYLLAFLRGDIVAAEALAHIRQQQGLLSEAIRVRRQLVCRGGPLGAEAWTKIEAWLAEQGAPVEPCHDPSREPVEMPWLE